MNSWFSALERTRNNVVSAITRFFSKDACLITANLEKLEEDLISADICPKLVDEWIKYLKKAYVNKKDNYKEEILKQLMLDTFLGNDVFDWQKKNGLLSILVIGVNGSGKTTTCAKLARIAQKAHKKVILAAADTYRAAGATQLKIWANIVDCEVVSGAPNADAAAVAYDATNAAIARNKNVLIIDTAGRMHTREPLMQELSKVKRAIAKRLPNAPDETWLVLDATIGRNALLQAKEFDAYTKISGVIVSKLDGSAKAGFIFSLRKELGVPIYFIGLGEGKDDLVSFDENRFVNALLGIKEK